jgi:hypothetical protein
LHDIKGAVEALPDPTRTDPTVEALRMTGTEGILGPVATQSATGVVSLPFEESTQVRAPQEWAESELNRRHQNFQATLDPVNMFRNILNSHQFTSNQSHLQGVAI